MMVTMKRLVMCTCVKVRHVNSYSFTQQRLLLMVFTVVAALKGEQADFPAEQDWPWGRF